MGYLILQFNIPDFLAPQPHRIELPRGSSAFSYTLNLHGTLDQIFTARVRSTTGGYVFTGVYLFNFREGGYPIPGLDRGVPHPADWGGYLILLDWGGLPHPIPAPPPQPGLDGVPP